MSTTNPESGRIGRGRMGEATHSPTRYVFCSKWSRCLTPPLFSTYRLPPIIRLNARWLWHCLTQPTQLQDGDPLPPTTLTRSSVRQDLFGHHHPSYITHHLLPFLIHHQPRSLECEGVSFAITTGTLGPSLQNHPPSLLRSNMSRGVCFAIPPFVRIITHHTTLCYNLPPPPPFVATNTTLHYHHPTLRYNLPPPPPLVTINTTLCYHHPTLCYPPTTISHSKSVKCLQVCFPSPPFITTSPCSNAWWRAQVCPPPPLMSTTHPFILHTTPVDTTTSLLRTRRGFF